MKKAKSWIILTVTFYLSFLFWTVPAQYVWSFIENRHPVPAGLVSVVGVDGTWTAGRVMRVKKGAVEISDLRWRLQPVGLLFGCLQVAVSGEIAGGNVAGLLRVGKNKLEIVGMQGEIPAASLGQTYLPGVELAGRVEIGELTLVGKDGRLIGGSGYLAWREGEVLSPYRMKLGGVMLNLATENDGVSFKLKDLGGGLQTNGLGVLTGEGKYSFNGTVGARQGSSPELATFLQVLGRPGADGMVKINQSGQLPSFF